MGIGFSTLNYLPMKTTKNATSPPNTDIQVHFDFSCIFFSFFKDVQYPKYSESAVEFDTSAQYISSSKTMQLSNYLVKYLKKKLPSDDVSQFIPFGIVIDRLRK